MTQFRNELYHSVDMTGWSEAEIRSKMIWDLENMRMSEEDMIEHLQYCVDHEVWEAKDRIVEIARTRKRKWPVRKIAVEYTCRMLPLAEICEKVLPTLAGLQMIHVVERFIDTKDPMLLDFVWEYGEYYAEQKMPCDALAIKMQNRRGLASFRNHMERRGAATRAILYPDPIEAISEIYDVGLLDELERLLRLVLKDNFHDRKESSLRENLEKAFQNVADRGGDEAKKKVRVLLESYACQYDASSPKAAMLQEWLKKLL